MNVSVGILAGGKSSRMGSDKAFLKIGGKTFLQTLIDEFSFCDDLMVSLPEDLCLEPRSLSQSKCRNLQVEPSRNLRLIPDCRKDSGPLEGILQCLKNARNDFVFFCAVDMPFLKNEILFYINEFISSDYDIFCMKDENHIHPLCGIYSKKVLPVAEKMLEKGRFKLMELLDSSRTKFIDLKYTKFDSSILQNINTKEDFVQFVGMRLLSPSTGSGYHLPKCRKQFVFCVSGLKKSGKTWLVEKLVKSLTEKGFSVGTIKHDGHDFSVDEGETDSSRFYRAGAEFSAIFSKAQWNVHGRNLTSDFDEACFVEKILKNLPKLDFVIIEGMKSSDLPKIVIQKGDEKWTGEYKNVFATVHDFSEEAVENILNKISIISDNL